MVLLISIVNQELITESYVGLIIFNETAALFMTNKVWGTSEQLPALNTWFKLIEIILLICAMATSSWYLQDFYKFRPMCDIPIPRWFTISGTSRLCTRNWSGVRRSPPPQLIGGRSTDLRAGLSQPKSRQNSPQTTGVVPHFVSFFCAVWYFTKDFFHLPHGTVSCWGRFRVAVR